MKGADVRERSARLRRLLDILDGRADGLSARSCVALCDALDAALEAVVARCRGAA
jgi:hypothetical protein